MKMNKKNMIIGFSILIVIVGIMFTFALTSNLQDGKQFAYKNTKDGGIDTCVIVSTNLLNTKVKINCVNSETETSTRYFNDISHFAGYKKLDELGVHNNAIFFETQLEKDRFYYYWLYNRGILTNQGICKVTEFSNGRIDYEYFYDGDKRGSMLRNYNPNEFKFVDAVCDFDARNKPIFCAE